MIPLYGLGHTEYADTVSKYCKEKVDIETMRPGEWYTAASSARNTGIYWMFLTSTHKQNQGRIREYMAGDYTVVFSKYDGLTEHDIYFQEGHFDIDAYSFYKMDEDLAAMLALAYIGHKPKFF